MYIYIYMCIYIYVDLLAVVLNSFFCKRPFFANKKLVNLSRTPRLSFAGVSC